MKASVLTAMLLTACNRSAPPDAEVAALKRDLVALQSVVEALEAESIHSEQAIAALQDELARRAAP